MAVPVKLCRAHSSRTGKPCRRPAALGATVCASHGARAPQVREAARQRLEELIMPALATLRRVVTSGETDAVALQAARDILDRTGFRPIEKVDQATAIEIRVSYAEDVGILPAPPGTYRNGAHALDGQQSG